MPNTHDNVCVNPFDAPGVLIVTLDPISTVETDSVGVVALAIVLNVPVPDVETDP